MPAIGSSPVKSWLLAFVGVFAASPAICSRYLVTWAMETRDPSSPMPPAGSMGRDFLAVFDIERGSPRFEKLVAMLPVPGAARMAHHSNYEMPSDRMLFASDYMSGRGFVFDVRKPELPRLAASFSDAGAYTHPHSFARLPNGHTLATFQFKGEPDREAGALVELDDQGRMIRSSDAADSTVEPFIRPYSLLVLPKIDRVVTTSADMLPANQSSHVVQVWRLSDLRLIKTVVLPKAPHFGDVVSKGATEARVLADGKSVLVVTGACGLYRMTGLESSSPAAEFVYDFGYRACGVPVVAGRYWVQTTMGGHSLVSLDVSDPSTPREAGHLILDSGALPHWVSREPDGNRLAITGYGSLTTRLLLAKIDFRTGALNLITQIDFSRRWPDGWNGPAMPHAAVFSPSD